MYLNYDERIIIAFCLQIKKVIESERSQPHDEPACMTGRTRASYDNVDVFFFDIAKEAVFNTESLRVVGVVV